LALEDVNVFIEDSSRAILGSKLIMLMGLWREAPFGPGMERIAAPERVPLGISMLWRLVDLEGSSCAILQIKLFLYHFCTVRGRVVGEDGAIGQST
jgi:hypothetical protein